MQDDQSCLVAMQKLIQNTKNSKNYPQDDEFLLKFLRAKNFKVEDAFTSLNNYLQMRKTFPSTFYPSAVKHALESGMVTVLKHRDVEGRQIFYFRTYLWDTTKVNAEEAFIACTLVLEEMVNSVETQLMGVAMIHDMKALGLSHCWMLGLREIKRMYRVKSGFPAKFKKADAINPNKLFYTLYSIACSLVPKKLLKRCTIHGKDLSRLYETVPKNILPTSLGGDLSDDEAIDSDLMNRLKERDEHFKITSTLICRGE